MRLLLLPVRIFSTSTSAQPRRRQQRGGSGGGSSGQHVKGVWRQRRRWPEAARRPSEQLLRPAGRLRRCPGAPAGCCWSRCCRRLSGTRVGHRPLQFAYGGVRNTANMAREGRAPPEGGTARAAAWGTLGSCWPPHCHQQTPRSPSNARRPRDGARWRKSPGGRASCALPCGLQALHQHGSAAATPERAPAAAAPGLTSGGRGGGGRRLCHAAAGARRPGSCRPLITAARLLRHRCAAAQPCGVRPVPPPHGGRHRRRLASRGVSKALLPMAR